MSTRHERTFLDLLKALEEHPEWRDHLRQLLLSRELLDVPERLAFLTRTVQDILHLLEQRIRRMDRLEEAIAELAEAQRQTETALTTLTEVQRRTEERLNRLEQVVHELAEAQKRTEERLGHAEERLDRLEQAVHELTEAQKRTEQWMEVLARAQQHVEEDLRGLLQWQRGEEGRREGERYERKIIRTAIRLFQGGEGGSPDDERIRLRLITEANRAGIYASRDEEDPLLADLIWWKDSKVLVVEISLAVDRKDVERASLRARTLRYMGLDALGVVVGERWATPDVQERAHALGVAWYVGGTYSEDLMALRHGRG